jgi:hypothetical protein
MSNSQYQVKTMIICLAMTGARLANCFQAAPILTNVFVPMTAGPGIEAGD